MKWIATLQGDGVVCYLVDFGVLNGVWSRMSAGKIHFDTEGDARVFAQMRLPKCEWPYLVIVEVVE